MPASERATERRGPSTSPAGPAERRRDALLVALTFAAGVVDAVSYLGLGQIFTANMTGNVVFLALAVGEGNLATALHSVGALLGFSVGALIAGQILGRPREPGIWPRQVTRVLWAELACVAAFAVAWAAVGGAPGPDWIYGVIGLSSLGMGMQNAAARQLAVPGLTTTVITTALAGFMVDLPALGISGSGQRRFGLAVVAILSGAAVGAILMLHVRAAAPLLTVLTVASVVVLAGRIFGRPTPNPS
jgi:uncharacterized membrane protein YoaK (UPF0700 family)